MTQTEDSELLPLIEEPADGVPEPLETTADVAAYAAALRAATGPVAIDAERASGFRYGQRAYLIQLRRVGAGTALIDPVAVPDLTDLADALRGQEWILHSSTQDLPCLAEVGLQPDVLFDTELAARLINLPRVGLANITAELLGLRLAKGHSAADWSTRPLPHSWLRYAALDVEVLPELREILDGRLREAGKRDWAAEEFAYLATRWRPAVKSDPWRRVSGIHALRDRRQLEIVRRLWLSRDEAARNADRAPGRLLRDEAIMAIATSGATNPGDLAALPALRRVRRASQWWPAVADALAVPEGDLPPLRGTGDGPPPTKVWQSKDPDAAARFDAVRPVVLATSQEYDLPAEILISPDHVRRLAWRPLGFTRTEIADQLREYGAREWQIDLLADRFAAALTDHPRVGPLVTDG